MMPLKTRIMKFINSQLTVAVLAAIFSVGTANAQEIIKDSVKTKSQNQSNKKIKLENCLSKQKILLRNCQSCDIKLKLLLS